MEIPAIGHSDEIHVLIIGAGASSRSFFLVLIYPKTESVVHTKRKKEKEKEKESY